MPEKGGIAMERDLLQRLAAWTQLPADAMSDAVRVTLNGRLSVLIENHGGLLEYTRACIRVRAGKGEVCIRGDGLEIRQMSARMLQIGGRIRDVAV